MQWNEGLEGFMHEGITARFVWVRLNAGVEADAEYFGVLRCAAVTQWSAIGGW